MPHCVLCKSFFVKFIEFNGRPNAGCPVCKSAERHRLVGYYMNNYINLPPLSVLHLSPEKTIYNILHNYVREYVCADLNPDGFKPLPCIKLDITDINCEDNKYDMIIASHILEHVLDDRVAMKELLRVLVPKGKLIALVPQNFNSEVTDEDSTITDPLIRTKRFGQYDHVRLYGLDFSQRLKEAGFYVKAYIPTVRIPDARKMQLDSVEVISDQFVMTDNGFSQWDILYECTKLK